MKNIIKNNDMFILFLLFIICIIYIYQYNEQLLVNSRNLVNDISEMNQTKILDTIDVVNIKDIIKTLKLSLKNNNRLSMYGSQHSMGGQTIVQNGYRLNMNNFNKILKFDRDMMTITVEPGLKWDELIRYLNTYGYSPMTLQSYSTFTIGGTISVNAHGLTNDETVIGSIVDMTILLSDMTIQKCSKYENSKLFSLVVGGYGLFGIILEVTLKVTFNEKYKMTQFILNTDTFEEAYQNARKHGIVKLAKINVVNFDQIYFYELTKQNKPDQIIVSKLNNKLSSMSAASQMLYKWALPFKSAQKIRYGLEQIKKKPLEVTAVHIEKNQLLFESTVPITKLKNILIDLNQTHILQEFFIPDKDDNFKKWMKIIKQYFVSNNFKNVLLLNIAIRYVKADNLSFLSYAKHDSYAFVFYYRITKTKFGDNELNKINMNLIDNVIKLNGTFYLPYRHHYTKNQLLQCYPEFKEFSNLKDMYDKKNVFGNMWFDKYKNNL